MKHIFKFILILTLIAGCDQKKKDSQSEETNPSTSAEAKIKYLYVTTGACYSGGNTTFTTTTASNLIYRLSLTNGQKNLQLADYYSLPANPGDSPISLIEQDSENLLILVENTTGRRIEKLAKSNNPARPLFSSNSTVLSSTLRQMIKTSDNGLLISKSSGIEKISSQGMRIGTPYVASNMGATCGTNTNITAVATTTSGKIFFTNAVAANNRFGVIAANGYSTASDCLAVQAAPNVNSFPVAITYLEAYHQVIVAYAGNSLSPDINSIYVYDFNDSTNTLSNPTKLYDANTYITAGYLMYGISAMAYNSDESSFYVSTAISSATTVVNYVIEKLNYNPVSKTLSRVGSIPFYNFGVDTKCISHLLVAE